MVEVDGYEVTADHWIDGEWVPSPERFESRSPNDWDTVLARVARGGPDEVGAAVEAATRAAPIWATLSPAQRAGHLYRLAEIIDSNVDRVAMVETMDMAMLHRSLRERLVHRGAENFRNYADLAAGHVERNWQSKGTNNTVVRMPAGPAAVITPWNAPWMLSTWKVAPALAAGNPVVLKPAEWAPLSASLLAEFTRQAGFPPGVFNVVHGLGEEAGLALVSDPRIRRISFTGSPGTGRIIGRAAAENLVPFTAELGGKGPLLVFEDADIEAAAHRAAWQYDDSGQVCLAGTRLLVHESLSDRFLDRFHDYVSTHVLGDSRNPDTTIAPMIHPEHRRRVHGFVERARANGDEVVMGGKPVEGGLWYEPTLVYPASNDSEVVQKEVFGPVLTYQTFSDESEAVDLANSTRYGLSGIVFTASAERAERVGRAIRAGTVWVNTFLVRDLTAPFGGCRISGIGREGGHYALEFHSDLKTLQILDGSVD